MSTVRVTRATEAAEQEAAQQSGYVTLRSVQSRVSLDWRVACRSAGRPFVELHIRGKRARLVVEMEYTGRLLTAEGIDRFHTLMRTCRRSYGGYGELVLVVQGLEASAAPGIVETVLEFLHDPSATRPDPASVWSDVARALATAKSSQEYRHDPCSQRPADLHRLR